MCVNLAQKQCNVWDTSEIEGTGGPGIQGTLLIPTEPIVLHKTIRHVQKVSNKRQAIVRTIAVQRTKESVEQ